jgi:SAM-dependent methyltransferase
MSSQDVGWVIFLVSFAMMVGCILYMMWLVFPVIAGLPWVPTQTRRIQMALDLAQVQPGETVYDLGAGDGRVLVIAAGEFGARAVGIEISPIHCAVAWLNARRHQVGGQVSVRWDNFYYTPLGDADVVYAYMTSRQTARLMPHLAEQLRPGTRVVTISFDLPGWQPDDFDQENLIFLYIMPPTPGSLGAFLTQQLLDEHNAEADSDTI